MRFWLQWQEHDLGISRRRVLCITGADAQYLFDLKGQLGFATKFYEITRSFAEMCSQVMIEAEPTDELELLSCSESGCRTTGLENLTCGVNYGGWKGEKADPNV